MNDCCEDNSKCRWGVGANMPGYMPDNDVAHFANWKDARAYYVEEVSRAIEEAEKPECYSVEKRGAERAAKARKAQEFQSGKIENYIYWLSRI